MKKLVLILFASALFSCQFTQKKSIERPSEATLIPSLLTQSRQLTFSGPRSGEGYFSKTGDYMIFQSERDPNNPFYQIYLMNMKTGITQKISPGFGNTTCSWIHPFLKKVMFSSTHSDPNWR